MTPTLSTVTINVTNLSLMTQFYQQVIGLQLLKENPTSVDLGVPGQTDPLLRLIVTDQPAVQTYGLFHIAILHPDRTSLASHFRYLLVNQVPLQGASDHAYSEALYLADPEGNGIELYADRPKETWDVRPDGRIIGTTQALDADDLLAQAQPTEGLYQLPTGTSTGHVHLSVANAGQASQLYQTLFGMTDKFSMPTASWIAWGSYHHHLAANHWAGQNLPKRQPGQPGLAQLSIRYTAPAAFAQVRDQAILHQLTLLLDTRDELLIQDPDGLVFHIYLT